MKIEEKLDNYINEDKSLLNEKNITYEHLENFKTDPLFQEILNSKTKDEFENKLKKLHNERGEEAVNNFTQMLKAMKNK